jgi:tetratricopeptide (TPR) repeat protein
VSDNDVSVPSQAEEEVAEVGGDQASASGDGSPGQPRELTDADRAKLAELSEAIEKFTAQKRWSDVIKATLQKAEIVVDSGDKVALLADAGRMYIERSSNQAEAIKCFQRILDVDRSNVEAIGHLREMYEKRRDWERLVDVMRAECDLLDASDQPMRRLEIAQMANEKLRKPTVCIDLWREVLAVDPDSAEALGALAGLYERAREWAPLAEVLDRQSQQAKDNAEVIAILQKLGNVYAEKLQDDNGALSAYRRLLELDPNDRRAQEQLKKRWVATGAWDELEEFYSSTDKIDELIRTLERAADATTTEVAERISLLFRIARLWQDKKGAADRAARSYEKVLTLDAQNQEAAEALSPIYEHAGDAKKLAGVYEVRLSHLQDPEARVVLLRETGLLYEEKLRNAQLAFDRFLEAFVLDPKQSVLREDLDRLAAKVNGWEKVFSAYDAAIDASTHPDDANDLRLFYGQALSGQGKTKEAIAQFRAVYDDRADDATAIVALEKLYRETGDFQALLGVLSRRAELEGDVGARKQLAYDVARLWHEHLKNADQAIEAYKNIPIEFGEGETEAYRALDALYEQAGRWDDLAQTLEHRIDIGPDSHEELAALKFRLASALHLHLKDKARAIELYREVLMLVPEHEGALGALESLLSDDELGGQAAAIAIELYEAQGNFAKLVHSLEVLLKFTSEPEQRIDLITKVGEVRAAQLQDGAGAFAAYAQAFEEAPDNPGIVARLSARWCVCSKRALRSSMTRRWCGSCSSWRHNCTTASLATSTRLWPRT